MVSIPVFTTPIVSSSSDKKSIMKHCGLILTFLAATTSARLYDLAEVDSTMKQWTNCTKLFQMGNGNIKSSTIFIGCLDHVAFDFAQ